MSDHPTFEELEKAASGGEDRPEVVAHAAKCAECAREVAWLRAEAQLVRRRAQPPVRPEIWRAIEERIHAPIPISRARRFRPMLAAAAAVAAAAALAVVVRPRNPPPAGGPLDASVSDEVAAETDPKARQALDRAAVDYRSALGVLEQEYASARARFDSRTQKRWDESFARARSLIDASAQARNDPEERVKLLDGSAVMVRSLRHAIEDSEEVAR
ncbi:MAG: hypothetical protein ACJ79H_20825 [Myxococcales bacterium]